MKILAVSHEASATGAPIFFLTLLEWLKAKKPTWEIDVLVVKDGVIRSQFEAIGRSLVLADYSNADDPSLVGNFTQGRAFDLVYLNTLETAHILQRLVELDIVQPETKVISHIHELEGTIRKYGPDRIQVLNKVADRIITVSGAVRDNLVNRHAFQESKISVINPCSRTLQVQPFQSEDQIFFKQYANRKMVLGCGEISVGKGVDVFIRTAMQVREFYRKNNLREDFFFAWLGPDSYKIRTYFENDLDVLSLRDIVCFFGHRDSVFPFFQRCEALFMCSRQDSFPLVCLEASSMKKPVVYFPEAGGIKDFLGTERGYPVRYLDSDASAEVFIEILRSPEVAQARANEAFHNWQERYSADRVLGEVLKVIDHLVGTGGSQL